MTRPTDDSAYPAGYSCYHEATAVQSKQSNGGVLGGGMNIRAIGELRSHSDVPEWLMSSPIGVPYFDGLPLSFILDGLGDIDEREAAEAIESFLNLGPADRLAASPYVYKNYLSVADVVDDEGLGCRIDSDAEVWRHVRPSEVFVSRRSRRDRAIYIQIPAECDWEPEHGLQIIYRRGSELSRVSEQDGHLTHADAYDLAEDQDRIA